MSKKRKWFRRVAPVWFRRVSPVLFALSALMILAEISTKLIELGGHGSGLAMRTVTPPTGDRSLPGVVSTPTLDCGPVLTRIIEAMRSSASETGVRRGDIYVRIHEPHKNAKSSRLLSLPDGSESFALDWLPVAGVRAHWDQDREILVLRHQEDNECLIFRGGRDSVTLVKAGSPVQFSCWWNQALHGINVLVAPPRIEAIQIRSAPVSIAHDPIMTLRIAVAALGPGNKIEIDAPAEGGLDHNWRVDISLARPLREIEAHSEPPLRWRAPAFLDTL